MTCQRKSYFACKSSFLLHLVKFQSTVTQPPRVKWLKPPFRLLSILCIIVKRLNTRPSPSSSFERRHVGTPPLPATASARSSPFHLLRDSSFSIRRAPNTAQVQISTRKIQHECFRYMDTGQFRSQFHWNRLQFQWVCYRDIAS